MQRRTMRWTMLGAVTLLVTLAGSGGRGGAAGPGAGPPGGPPSQATAGVRDPLSQATPGVSDPLTVVPGGGSGAIVPGEVLVRFRPPPGEQTVPANRPATLLAAAGVPGSVTRRLEAVDGFVVNVAPGDESKAADLLTAAPDVIAASPNRVRHIHRRLPAPGLPAPAAAPNDPLYPVQWAYERINAPPAWGLAQRAVTVAVLDTGLDSSHPEFSGRVVAGVNFVQAGQPPTDDNGHGTHVAGLIAAAGGNGIGGVGVAWQARIMPIKVADSSGNLTSEAWLNGIAWAVAHGADRVLLVAPDNDRRTPGEAIAIPQSEPQ